MLRDLAADDLGRATDIARQLITRFGMSAALGQAVLERQQASYLGDSLLHQARKDYSEQTAREIDQETRRIVDRLYGFEVSPVLRLMIGPDTAREFISLYRQAGVDGLEDPRDAEDVDGTDVEDEWRFEAQQEFLVLHNQAVAHAERITQDANDQVAASLEHAQRMQLGAREEELEPLQRHLGEARAAAVDPLAGAWDEAAGRADWAQSRIAVARAAALPPLE